jgi:hypothetical protein
VDDPWGSPDDFRRQTRSLWIAPNDVAFWQGALRDESDELQQAVAASVAEGAVTVDLLYLDHEGGQQTVSRFSFIRREIHPHELSEDHRAQGVPGVGSRDDDRQAEGERTREQWWVSLSMHRTLDA